MRRASGAGTNGQPAGPAALLQWRVVYGQVVGQPVASVGRRSLGAALHYARWLLATGRAAWAVATPVQ